jgi:hypothetical protein
LVAGYSLTEEESRDEGSVLLSVYQHLPCPSTEITFLQWAVSLPEIHRLGFLKGIGANQDPLKLFPCLTAQN